MNCTAFNVVYLTFRFHFVSVHVTFEILFFCFNAKVAALGMGIRMSFNNSHANLKFYMSSLKGFVQHFIISLDEEHMDMFIALNYTSGLFQRLMEKTLRIGQSVRLTAKVNLLHVNQEAVKLDERSHHFLSYSCEKVYDVQDFYERHD